MKIISVNNFWDIPKNFTGVVEYKFGNIKEWYKNYLLHREDGPARIYKNKGYYFLYNKNVKEKELYWFLVLTFIKNNKEIPNLYLKDGKYTLIK